MDELKERLEKELKNILENSEIQIKAARRLAIKNLGLKEVDPYTSKGFKEPKNALKWGSAAGYDTILYVRDPEAKEREATVVFTTNGNGFLTNKITLPVGWVKDIGVTEEDRKVVLIKEDNKIIIEKR